MIENTSRISNNLALCICTYKRNRPLQSLLLDIQKQTSQPGTLIIVDGEPDSGEVQALLHDMKFPKMSSIYYVPSNRANLPYQRFLGWRISKSIESEILLYLDDDLRLMDSDIIKKLMLPFTWSDHKIIAVTALTITGKDWVYDEINHGDNNRGVGKIIEWFGASKNYVPGGLTPYGNRILPSELPDHPGFGIVAWMQGRVMAFLDESISEKTYNDDLFAIHHINLGLGEETFLARRLVVSGEIACATNLQIEHPGTFPPNAYPIKAFTYGYAVAYSRRFINDYYRGFQSPTLGDRFLLLKTYVGNLILNVINMTLSPRKSQLAYLLGYSLGMSRAVYQPPRAQKIAPEINWQYEADKALEGVIKLQG